MEEKKEKKEKNLAHVHNLLVQDRYLISEAYVRVVRIIVAVILLC